MFLDKLIEKKAAYTAEKERIDAKLAVVDEMIAEESAAYVEPVDPVEPIVTEDISVCEEE